MYDDDDGYNAGPPMPPEVWGLILGFCIGVIVGMVIVFILVELR